MTTPYSPGVSGYSDGVSRPVDDDRDQKGIGELIGEITSDLSQLFRQELDLAKAELRQEAKKAGKGSGMLAGAGIAALLVLILLSFALVYALDAVMPQGWAAFIVAVLWAIIGAVLYSMGRKQLKTVDPVPRQTTETLKEDAQWLRNPTG
jgi:protein-S-isoprenylcysteine O-methyltransferase Ste14